MEETIIVTIGVIFMLFITGTLSYEEGYYQGKCEGMYGTGAIYGDGQCFRLITK